MICRLGLTPYLLLVLLFVQANAQQKHEKDQGTWAQAQQSLNSEIEMLKKDAESSLKAKVRHLYLHFRYCCNDIIARDEMNWKLMEQQR